MTYLSSFDKLCACLGRARPPRRRQPSRQLCANTILLHDLSNLNHTVFSPVHMKYSFLHTSSISMTQTVSEVMFCTIELTTITCRLTYLHRKTKDSQHPYWGICSGSVLQNPRCLAAQHASGLRASVRSADYVGTLLSRRSGG